MSGQIFQTNFLYQFEQEIITVPYKKQERDFVVYYRPIWSWILDLLKDNRIVSCFTWDAQRLFRFESKSNVFIRYYDEPWTGNRFWDVQVCSFFLFSSVLGFHLCMYFQSAIPENGKPFCFLFYADKNKLSSFGTLKGYPVVLRCLNLPVNIRNSDGIGGGIIVGWLPIVSEAICHLSYQEILFILIWQVPEDANDNKKSSFANFKNAVWHAAVGRILSSIKKLTKLGYSVKCGDGITRDIYPCMLTISADYEEQ